MLAGAVAVAMNLADIRLASLTEMLPDAYSWTTILTSTVAALGLTNLVAVALLPTGRTDRYHHVAFGPGVIAGALVWLLLAA